MTPVYTPELFSALILFAFATLITPGPNNTMILASGANFGLGRTLPHLGGVVLGSSSLILLCGLGLAGVFAAFPVLHDLLKWGGAAYLLYLAFRIATAGGIGAKTAGVRPIRFWQAFGFQYVNPKAWAVALGAVSTYVPARGFLPGLAVAILVMALIGVPCTLTWAAFGVGLRRFLDRPSVLRAFNVAMALLLVASLVPLFAELGPGRRSGGTALAPAAPRAHTGTSPNRSNILHGQDRA
jgi:threonine/homoserine/homoserine lactone efflux protein